MASKRQSIGSLARLGALCFVGGFVDIVGVLSVIGIYVAHITGNLALAGSSFIHHQPNVGEKLIAVPSFIGGVVVGTVLNHWARVYRFNPERILISLEAACLIAFMIWGEFVQRHARLTSPSDATMMALTTLAIFAMGLHNAATREARQMPTTTGMTANLTQLTMDVTDLCLRGPNRPALKAHARRGFVAVGSFLFGAVLGTAGFVRFQFWSVALPIAILIALAITPPASSPIPVPRRGRLTN